MRAHPFNTSYNELNKLFLLQIQIELAMPIHNRSLQKKDRYFFFSRYKKHFYSCFTKKCDKIIQFFPASALQSHMVAGDDFHNKLSITISVPELLAAIPTIRQKNDKNNLVFRHRSRISNQAKSKLTHLFFSDCMMSLLFLGRVATRTFARMCTLSPEKIQKT